jgi:hypothetical protein
MTGMSWHQQRAAGMHALPDDIVAYTYRAANYCPRCIVGRLTVNPGDTGHRTTPWDTDPDTVETHLDTLARLGGIDRDDERSFDSGDFPKVVFRDSADDYAYTEGEPERCATCGEAIV